MIRALVYNRESKALKEGGLELAQDSLRDPANEIWLDLYDEPRDAEKKLLCEHSGLHPLAVQDAQRDRHPPKIETFEGYVFVLLKELAADTVEVEFATTQLAVFAGERFLITRHRQRSPCVEALFEQVKGERRRFKHGVAALAIALFRRLVDRYLNLLLDLEPRLEILEDDMFVHPNDKMLVELLGYKTELKKFRRIFIYHEHIFRDLKNHPGGVFGEARQHELMDVYEHQERASSLTGLYYELASDLIDGYISVASHRLNQIMRILTVVMSIFVPLSFLAGVYGMNFENMPELKSRSGYFILLSIMGGIVLILLLIFRKKRWL